MGQRLGEMTFLVRDYGNRWDLIQVVAAENG